MKAYKSRNGRNSITATTVASFEHRSDHKGVHIILGDVADHTGIVYTLCGERYFRGDGYCYVGTPNIGPACRWCAYVVKEMSDALVKYGKGWGFRNAQE